LSNSEYRLNLRAAIGSLALTTVSLATGAETPRSGSQLFTTYCSACHASGWNEAPVAGIKDDWQPRIAKGLDVMLANTKQGIGAMPAMGTCNQCSDAELKSAIEEMIKF
jgi:cytochrome c5